MFDKSFEIRIDASKCTSLVGGGAFLDGKKEYDFWRFRDIKLESGKIYGLVGEYGQGPMYMSYLISRHRTLVTLVVSYVAFLGKM